jgi:hypothetical protein
MSSSVLPLEGETDYLRDKHPSYFHAVEFNCLITAKTLFVKVPTPNKRIML